MAAREPNRSHAQARTPVNGSPSKRVAASRTSSGVISAAARGIKVDRIYRELPINPPFLPWQDRFCQCERLLFGRFDSEESHRSGRLIIPIRHTLEAVSE